MRSGHAPTLTATIPSVALLGTPIGTRRRVTRCVRDLVRSGHRPRERGDAERGRERRRPRRGKQGRRPQRFDFAVPLPARDVRSRSKQSTRVAAAHRRRSAPSSRSRRPPSRAGRREGASRILSCPHDPFAARAFPGICGVYVQDAHGRRAPRGTPSAFPAASTSRLRSRSRSSAGSAAAARTAGWTCSSARRSSRPTTGGQRPAHLARRLDERRRRPCEPALPRARDGRHGHVRRLHHHARPDPDPGGRSTELRRQTDVGSRPRDAHALAEPGGGRAGRAGLGVASGRRRLASSSTCSRTHR